MMGTTKLSTIRERVRKSFKKSDGELLAWFNLLIEERESAKEEAGTEIETLLLFRDALKEESKRKPLKKARRRPVSN